MKNSAYKQILVGIIIIAAIYYYYYQYHNTVTPDSTAPSAPAPAPAVVKLQRNKVVPNVENNPFIGPIQHGYLIDGSIL